MESHEIAIAGIGTIAETHAKAIADIDNAELVAGSCRTPERGREFADAHDCTWYDNTEAMVAAESIDVLSVCTPSGAHLEPTRAAADHGVDVICEKPLEITTDRIDEMAAVTAEADVRLGGIFQQRYGPAVQRLVAAAEDGRFGDLSTCNAVVPWWRDVDYYADGWQGTASLDGGGALMNQAIHAIDLVQWIANTASDADPDENPVSEVFGYTGQRAHTGGNMEVADTGVAVVRYNDGALGQILGATSMYPGTCRRIHVGGRDGTAELRRDQFTTWQFRDDRAQDPKIREEFGERNPSDDSPDPSVDDAFKHQRNIEDFLRACETDAPFAIDVSEARKSVAIIEAIADAAETGEPVQLS